MLLKIRHALLEISNHPVTKQSAIIINNEIIITSGCILQPYVRPMTPFIADHNKEGVCPSTKIIHKLQQCQLISVQDCNSVEAKHLNALNYQVTFDRRKLPPPNERRRQPHILTRYCARLLFLFSSSEISRHVLRFLETDHTDDALKSHNEVLLSSFLVLSMRCDGGKEYFEKFLRHIEHYLRYLQPIHTLDDVLVMCTPFGLENFYKTISIGKVSNVMGRDGCLFVLSNALALGCEGAAVFNNKLRLIGMIMCTSFQRQQENVNLTLAANFAFVLRDFMRQLGLNIMSVRVARDSSNFPWERAMVVIEAGGSQGTGTFVKVLNKKFILTCTHVVFKLSTKAFCRSVDGEFESEVLWRNPQYDQPFDIALLAAPANIPERYCVRLSSAKPTLGQTVFNAGFPYFVNFNLKYDFNPAIFQGRVIKCSPGAIMSDGCVQAGQSGGPMFDDQGYILGICVSNIKVGNVVYPNLNTAVPIYQIRTWLEQYARTNDVQVLSNLVANKEMQRIWALEAPPVLSKL
ncbi:uncharacterized protein LOC129246444 isoform X1 [Anastrepha obliqua]|uniref:uncharacterized protein LOC129246444 isoform X1 n=2 Tax=Anastrepha obliqua TaxID=95512 RepID=UPI00240A4A45|nr:uncharacterized protein LOC129246444 isoform X1 [Anastrepha obliqua]XP_054741259.1 uncharacterized protein LOC129246444 isoform X1 [Anastrepha obliqua]XP_054741260.1 uncharacterized protein LOC129246444 isoform X1 [Anastrepha obliqua]XP_054741261.1 uncharacterized protein LOC129246444 isoform X1 [Anastrepha obliqua]XP_054741262.1 uncharacterized protein LOC129246444 isoform X1 [Anastrepha obliqua]